MPDDAFEILRSRPHGHVAAADEDALYQAIDWLVVWQERLDHALARRYLTVVKLAQAHAAP